VLGTIALLLAAEVRSTSTVERVLRSGPMLGFGRLSYSWYFWPRILEAPRRVVLERFTPRSMTWA
jgi:peptidoglycan/LPS O-acetylase OafA/YrhL